MTELCGFLYNTCYGGFCLSNLVLELYNKKKKEEDPDFKMMKDGLCSELNLPIYRSDPVLIQIFDEIEKHQFQHSCSRIEKKMIEKKYIDFVVISEYDGLENIKIDFNKYYVFHIKQILSSSSNNDKKVNAINTLFLETNEITLGTYV